MILRSKAVAGPNGPGSEIDVGVGHHVDGRNDTSAGNEAVNYSSPSLTQRVVRVAVT